MKNLKTIYEILSEYSEEEINAAIKLLTDDQTILIYLANGKDLKHPVRQIGWDSKKMIITYHNILNNQLKTILKRNRNTEVKEEKTVETKKLEEPKEEKTEEIKPVVALVGRPNVGKSTIFNKMVDEKLSIIEDTYNVSEEIFSLISKSISADEICNKLNINRSRLIEELRKLRNYGANITTQFTSSGVINVCKGVNRSNILATPSDSTELKFLLISDLHFGNKNARVDLVEKAFDYCRENNIHVILNGGDNIDGAFTAGEQNISNYYKQIEYFITHYPSQDGIVTYTVLGDHDESLLRRNEFDFNEALRNYRPDILALGYSDADLRILKSGIHLRHKIAISSMSTTTLPIILNGHFHVYKTNFQNNKLNIFLPSLSNIIGVIPSMVELNLRVCDENIVRLTAKQIGFLDGKCFVMSENAYNVPYGQKILTNH